MRVIHIITGLSTGGAEMMLYKLLSRIDRDEFEPEVISLTDAGPVADKIKDLGIPVHELGMKRGRFNPLSLIKLSLQLRKESPDLVQTWLYHSDFIGGLAAKFAGNIKVIWSIRQSNIDADANKRSTMLIAKICAKLSSWLPDKIICCSHAAQQSHLALGYSNEKMFVIPNGFNLDVFLPDKNSRKSVRKELGIGEKDCLVGLVARFDPQKDHRNFIQAAGIVQKNNPSAHFMLCGEGITDENHELMQWISQAELGENIHLLGIRNDVPRLVAAMDIAVSSSLGEGFPNVVGEAMSCAVPCVVTDVGDSALLVGNSGRVVTKKDPVNLAAEIIDLLQAAPESRDELGKKARQRIKDNFSLDSVVQKYEEVYRGVCG